jgi:hypothetical protein
MNRLDQRGDKGLASPSAAREWGYFTFITMLSLSNFIRVGVRDRFHDVLPE